MDEKVYKKNDTKVSKVTFAPIDQVTSSPQKRDIGMYVDLPRKMRVELGRTKKNIRDVLNLDIGAIVELNKQAGESVDVYIDDTLIARGEVVVVDEKFAVRITDIVSLTDLEKRVL